MNVKEVFCDYCYRWKKREDLVEVLNRGGELYCEECGAVLIRTDDYNPNKERKYTVRFKGIDGRFNWLMYDRMECIAKEVLMTSNSCNQQDLKMKTAERFTRETLLNINMMIQTLS